MADNDKPREYGVLTHNPYDLLENDGAPNLKKEKKSPATQKAKSPNSAPVKKGAAATARANTSKPTHKPAEKSDKPAPRAVKHDGYDHRSANKAKNPKREGRSTKAQDDWSEEVTAQTEAAAEVAEKVTEKDTTEPVVEEKKEEEVPTFTYDDYLERLEKRRVDGDEHQVREVDEKAIAKEFKKADVFEKVIEESETYGLEKTAEEKKKKKKKVAEKKKAAKLHLDEFSPMQAHQAPRPAPTGRGAPTEGRGGRGASTEGRGGRGAPTGGRGGERTEEARPATGGRGRGRGGERGASSGGRGRGGESNRGRGGESTGRGRGGERGGSTGRGRGGETGRGRGGDRGGRGRGAATGGRGNNTGGRNTSNVNISDESAFPALSMK